MRNRTVQAEKNYQNPKDRIRGTKNYQKPKTENEKGKNTQSSIF